MSTGVIPYLRNFARELWSSGWKSWTGIRPIITRAFVKSQNVSDYL